MFEAFCVLFISTFLSLFPDAKTTLKLVFVLPQHVIYYYCMYPSIDNIFMWLFFFFAYLQSLIASLMAQMIKHLPPMRETQVHPLGQEDPLEKEMATHCSTLAWRIPWTEEPGGLQSMASQSCWATHTHTHTHTHSNIFFLDLWTFFLLPKRPQCNNRGILLLDWIFLL